MGRKRVILTVTNDLNFDQRMIKICSALTEFGFDVLLVGRNLKNTPPLEPRKYKQHRINCSFEKGFLAYAEFNLKLFFYLFFKSASYVTANDLDTVLPVYFAFSFGKSKRIFDAHEYFVEVPELQNKSKTKRFWKWIERKFVPKFYRHYTVTASLQHIFEKELAVPFHLLRNVSQVSLEPATMVDLKKPYVLYQGALNEGRGLESLIDAFKELPFTLYLAGNGDIKQKLEAQIDNLKLNNKIHLLGRVSPRELKAITHNATVGVNLLESRSLNYYYSLANKFFDYANEGIPQINMDFPEYRLLVNQFPVGPLLKDLDSKILASEISKLMTNETLRKNCQKASKELIEAINWNIEKQELLKIYS